MPLFINLCPFQIYSSWKPLFLLRVLQSRTTKEYCSLCNKKWAKDYCGSEKLQVCEWFHSFLLLFCHYFWILEFLVVWEEIQINWKKTKALWSKMFARIALLWVFAKLKTVLVPFFVAVVKWGYLKSKISSGNLSYFLLFLLCNITRHFRWYTAMFFRPYFPTLNYMLSWLRGHHDKNGPW